MVFGDGPRPHELLRRLGLARRPLADRVGVRGHRAAQRPLARRPRRRRRSSAPTLVDGRRSGVDAETGARGRPRRAAATCFTDLDAPRGRLCVTDPDDARASSTGATCSPRTRRAVLDGVAILDGGELEHARLLLASWTPARGLRGHACTTWRPATRLGDVPLPGLGSIGGIVERPEGGHEVWFGYTDHTTPSSVHRYDARTGETTLWAAPPGRRRPARRPRAAGRGHQPGRHDGAHVRRRPRRRARRAGRAAGARADDPLRLRRLRHLARPRPTPPRSSRGSRPAASTSSPTCAAAARRARTGTAPGMLGAQAERLRRLPRRRRVARRARLDHAATSWPSAAAPTAACSSARRSRSDPTCSPPSSARPRCSTWCATSSSGSARRGTSSTAPPTMPEELGWLLAYSPYHRVVEGTDYPATLFTVFDGDTRVDPLHARKLCAALQHATSGDRPILIRARARRRARRPGGVAVDRPVGRGARLRRSAHRPRAARLVSSRAARRLTDPGRRPRRRPSPRRRRDTVGRLISLAPQGRSLVIVAAFVLRWLICRLIDRTVVHLVDNALARRLATTSAGGRDLRRGGAGRAAPPARPHGRRLLKSITTLVVFGIAFVARPGVARRRRRPAARSAPASSASRSASARRAWSRTSSPASS